MLYTMNIAYNNGLGEAKICSYNRKTAEIIHMSIWQTFSRRYQYVLISDIHCLRTCSHNWYKLYKVYDNRFPV